MHSFSCSNEALPSVHVAQRPDVDVWFLYSIALSLINKQEDGKSFAAPTQCSPIPTCTPSSRVRVQLGSKKLHLQRAQQAPIPVRPPIHPSIPHGYRSLLKPYNSFTKRRYTPVIHQFPVSIANPSTSSIILLPPPHPPHTRRKR